MRLKIILSAIGIYITGLLENRNLYNPLRYTYI